MRPCSPCECMILSQIFLGENDSFLRGREVCDRPCDITPTITHIVTDKFREDIKLLAAYVGENRFESGLSIEVTLNELLSVVPRKRRRKDAYEALVKYLKDERNIVLTIKSKKS